MTLPTLLIVGLLLVFGVITVCLKKRVPSRARARFAREPKKMSFDAQYRYDFLDE